MELERTNGFDDKAFIFFSSNVAMISIEDTFLSFIETYNIIFREAYANAKRNKLFTL